MKTDVDVEIPGLRAALVAEARCREKQAVVELKLERIHHEIAAATQKRHQLRVQAAAGEPIDVSEVERQLREANEAATFYSEALTDAQRQTKAASGEVAAALADESTRRLKLRQDEYHQTEVALEAAVAAYERAANALSGATRLRQLNAEDARRLYASEIARCG